MKLRPPAPRKPLYSAIAILFATMLCFVPSQALQAQSRAGSRAGSAALVEGSALITGGSAEILSSAASLVVTGVKTSARGVRLVLRPVGAGVSQAAEVSADITVEISLAAWEAARVASRVSGRALETSFVAVGEVLEVVAIHAVGVSGTATVVVGSALVVSGVVLAVIASEALEALLGHQMRPGHQMRHQVRP